MTFLVGTANRYVSRKVATQMLANATPALVTGSAGRSGHRSLLIVRVLTAVALTLAAVFASIAISPAANAAPSGSPDFDTRMVTLVNKARSDAGVPALQSATGLTRLSTWWSSQMANGATGDVLQHNPNAFQQTLSYGASNRTAWAENVAKWSPTSTTADAIFTAYMNSAGHRANILGSAYRFVGISSVTGSTGITYNTMTFTDKVDPEQVKPTPTMSASDARAYVSKLFVNILHRQADSGGLATFTTQLANGVSKTAVFDSLFLSTESLSVIVNDAYGDALGRYADRAGLAQRVANLAGGGNTLDLMTALYASPESITVMGRGSLKSWIDGLYMNLLHRHADATGLAHWVKVAGSQGRQAVAKSILTSGENRSTIVNGYYAEYLHRKADQGGLNAFIGLVPGANERAVPRSLATSGEFLTLARTEY